MAREEIQIGRPLKEVACRKLSAAYGETVATALKKADNNFGELYSKSDFVSLTNDDDNYLVNADDNTIEAALTRCTIAGGGSSSLPNMIGDPTKPGGPEAVGWANDTSYVSGSALVATIGGGYDNVNNQIAGTITGGGHNFIAYDSDGHGWIGGGSYNRIYGSRAGIAAGKENYIEASSTYCYIGGGYQNNAKAITYATIGGGEANIVRGHHSVCAGGKNNDAGGSYGAILGGENGTVTGNYGAIINGTGSTVAGGRSAVIGDNNTVDGDYSLVTGQSNDLDSYDYVVIAGRDVVARSHYSHYVGRTAMDQAGDNQIATLVQSGRITSASMLTLGNEIRLPAGKKSAGTVRVIVTGLRDGDTNSDANYDHSSWSGEFSFYWDGVSSGFVSDAAGAATPGSDTNRSLTAIDDDIGPSNPPRLRLYNSSGVGQLVMQAAGIAAKTVNFQCRLDVSMTVVD